MDTEENKKVVTRFAPSPTGFMHVGGVRTALFAWLFARKNNGTFILRLEDTDKEREVPGSLEHIMASLSWLGLNWDEGPDIGGPHAPYKQSERLDTYKKYATELYEKGLAYADPYTEDELSVFRAQADADKKPFLYRNYRPENPPAWDGTQPLRLKIRNIQKSQWHDMVRGDLEAGEEALDDFILIKSDGYPTYNFAHIIDDLLMGVTHIFRADEFISSTPKFLALYEALGIEHPTFVTLPPILGESGNKKLGKRDGAKDVLDYEKEGYLPDAMFNFLAFIGWNPGTEQEIMSKDEILQSFELNQIQTGGGKFNEEKLNWFNREYILRQSHEEQFSIFSFEISKTKWKDSEKVRDDIFMKKLLKIILDRIHVWGEVVTIIDAGEFDYFFETPTFPKEMLHFKTDTDDEKIKERLQKTAEIFTHADEDEYHSPESVKNIIWEYAEAEGRGQVLWPLRVALSGQEKSPDPFTLASILGKSETLSRIQKGIDIL
jgi:glutamyl-tRNA synthetase